MEESIRNVFDHSLAHEKIYFACRDDFGTQDYSRVLKRALINYRANKGLSLSQEGFFVLHTKRIFNFSNFPFVQKYPQSETRILFDRAISPYYIDTNNTIWLSDEMHILNYTLINNQDDFLKSLR